MDGKGYFITFEGIDGCGKTTQLKMTEQYLSEKGLPVLVIREPGSTPLSEKIRDILLNMEFHINPVSELMLYVAARAELTRDVIIPSLLDGKIILCDRFFDSTTAYQGYGRDLDIESIKRLHTLSVGQFIPDLTFLIDVDYETSLTRRKQKADRLESESEEFFNKVRKGFLEISRQEPNRIVVIDGRKSIEEIFSEVQACLWTRLEIK
ncbi:MAG: dTMP kinase [Candidatus Zixiibacteriota bacterium]